MLTRARAIQFDRPATSGRTNPSFITCETSDGAVVEVVAKFSAACEMRETNLAMEVIAACLADDLGLPIPEPFLVEFSTDWASLVPDPGRRQAIMASSSVAFGSRLVTGGYRVWSETTRIATATLPTALSIFAFDGFTQNPDRRVTNPNCLVKGDEVRIIDHEMAFSHRLMLNWVPPWKRGGLKSFETPGAHIFRNELAGKAIDSAPLRAAWVGLSDDRLAEYKRAIPHEWNRSEAAVEAAVKLVREVRQQIDECLAELRRVLS